jgi:hypothetical protein
LGTRHPEIQGQHLNAEGGVAPGPFLNVSLDFSTGWLLIQLFRLSKTTATAISPRRSNISKDIHHDLHLWAVGPGIAIIRI